MNKKEYKEHREKLRLAEKITTSNQSIKPYAGVLFQPQFFILAKDYTLAKAIVENNFKMKISNVVLLINEEDTANRTGVVLHLMFDDDLSVKEVRMRGYLDHYPDRFNVIEVRL